MEGAAQLSADAKDQSDLATHKAAEVGRLLEQANAAVESTRTTADFAFMLARAAADDRTAFDELLSNANDESSRFHKLALAAIVRIAADLGSNLTFGLDWTKIGFDPATADFADFVDFFRRRPTFDQPQILSTLSGQERFSKFDRFSFLDDVIEVTESILVLNAACRAMNEEAHIDKNIIGYSMYRDWWRMRASRNTSPRSHWISRRIPSWPLLRLHPHWLRRRLSEKQSVCESRHWFGRRLVWLP